MRGYLETLQTQLVDASRRLSSRRRRRWSRRGITAAVVVVVTGAPALAATGVWRPPIGNGRDPAPRATAQAPPSEQLAMLGVLRRPQTDADRGAAPLYALRILSGNSIEGVRTDDIRLLAKSPRDRGLVLVPVAHYAPEPPSLPADTPDATRRRLMRSAIDDALCLFQLDSVDGAGIACWSTADIREGRAWMSLGHRAAWIVPDGVATVRSDYPHAPTVEARVHDNLALYNEPKGRFGDPTTAWLDTQGATVRTIKPPAPPPDATTGFPAETDPVAPAATHTGGVRRVAISGIGLDARYELLVEQPTRRQRSNSPFIYITLERPACTGKRHVTELLGAIGGPQLQADIHPSTGDRDRARWCPGTYHGSLRYKDHRKPFGTFSFRVR
jgi:hypothetical protein